MFWKTIEASEYISMAYSEYVVNATPCFFIPKRNMGKLMMSSHDQRGMGAISISRNIERPETPLSYRFTGARKSVTPTEFIMPAMVSIMKLESLRSPFSYLRLKNFIVTPLSRTGWRPRPSLRFP